MWVILPQRPHHHLMSRRITNMAGQVEFCGRCAAVTRRCFWFCALPELGHAQGTELTFPAG